MIDASHNIKDPWRICIQSLEAIQEAYAKALLIDQSQLRTAQMKNDVVRCQRDTSECLSYRCQPLFARS